MPNTPLNLARAAALAVLVASPALPAQAAVVTPYVATYELADAQDFFLAGVAFIDAQFAAAFDALPEEMKTDPAVIEQFAQDRADARDAFVQPLVETAQIFGGTVPMTTALDKNDLGFMFVGRGQAAGLPFEAETRKIGEVQVEPVGDLTGKTINVSLSNESQTGAGPISFRLTPFVSVTNSDFEQFLPLWSDLVFEDLAIDLTLDEGESLDLDVTDAMFGLEAVELDPIINPDGLPISFAFMLEALDAGPLEFALLRAVIEVFDEDLGPVANTRLSGPPSSLLSAIEGPEFGGATVVPVPAAGPLLALGLGAFLMLRRRRGATV